MTGSAQTTPADAPANPLASLVRAGREKPPYMVIYGTQGVGKTTLACQAPRPIVLQTEDGLTDPKLLEIPRIPVGVSFGAMMSALEALRTGEHDYKTVIIDSVSANTFERAVQRETCDRHGWKTIETPGFGKGYKEAHDGPWAEFLSALRRLRNERGVAIIVVSHMAPRRITPPDSDGFDQYDVDLQKLAAAALQRDAEHVLFAHRPIVTKKDAANPQRTRAVGGGERQIWCDDRDSHRAKNRCGLPDQIAMDWALIEERLPWFQRARAETA